MLLTGYQAVIVLGGGGGRLTTRKTESGERHIRHHSELFPATSSLPTLFCSAPPPVSMAPLAAAPPFSNSMFASCRLYRSGSCKLAWATGAGGRRPSRLAERAGPVRITRRRRQSASVPLLARAANDSGASSSYSPTGPHDADGSQTSSVVPPVSLLCRFYASW